MSISGKQATPLLWIKFSSCIIDLVTADMFNPSYFSWTDDAVKKREKEKGVQTKDEIISRFRQQLGEMRSDRSFVKSLEDAVNASNDNLINHLRTEYKDKLKELDFNILTMMYSGLSIKSIAFYFRMTEPSIRTRKTRYKHLFEESLSPLREVYRPDGLIYPQSKSSIWQERARDRRNMLSAPAFSSERCPCS